MSIIGRSYKSYKFPRGDNWSKAKWTVVCVKCGDNKWCGNHHKP